MAWHVVVETTIDMDINIDKPQGIMPSIIKGKSTQYKGMEYDGMPMHPLCRVGRSDPGMQLAQGAHSLTVARKF